ncbi:MAG: lysophospholipid acyltransferase family protein [Bacteroidales bacterium]|nr:lysophospholipid acyltransferase family protein [Bacteroidales bacterium]
MKRILLFLYQWIILVPVFLVVGVLTALITTAGSFLFNSKFWGYYPAKYWARLMCFTALSPVEVVGRENLRKDQSYIFAANHQGAFDIYLIYGYLNKNFRWVMKQELRKTPFMGRACAEAGHIFVDRSSPKSIKETLANASRQLEGGLSVVIFPEGSRTQTGKMGRFKKGAFQIAVDLKLPVVPLTIEGSFHILPSGSNIFRPHKLRLIIHPPIESKGEGSEAIISLMDECRQAIASALPESDR